MPADTTYWITLNPYAIPATLSLLIKLLIVYFIRPIKINRRLSRLYSAMLAVAIVMSLLEISILNRLFNLQPSPFMHTYYVLSIWFVTLSMQLALLVAFEESPPGWLRWLKAVIYSIGLGMAGIIFFTNWIMVGAQPMGNYAYSRIPGAHYWLFEIFILAGTLSMLFLPSLGLGKQSSIATRNRCKLWMVAVAPMVILVVMITLLLHFNLAKFNTMVTLPLLQALYLVAMGYAIHTQRVLELDFYIPGTRARSQKQELYLGLLNLKQEALRTNALAPVLNRLAGILKCSVCLITDNNCFSASIYACQTMKDFPKRELRKLRHMLVLPEIRTSLPALHALMQQHTIGAIVPFFPGSRLGARWLLLGEAFTQRMYTSLDFRVLEQLLSDLGVLFLDHELATHDKTTRPNDHVAVQDVDTALSIQVRKSLDDQIAELESRIIQETLMLCGGNKSQAARDLGLRPNTLYYKLKRHGLLA